MTSSTPAGSDPSTRTETPGPATGRRRVRLLAGVAVGLIAVVATGWAILVNNRPTTPGFDSPEGIAALLAERGAPCEDFTADDGGRADSRGVCYVNGERIIIATFANRAEALAHWERHTGGATDNQTIGMVIGDRWTISGPVRSYLQHAAEVLEAEYRVN